MSDYIPARDIADLPTRGGEYLCPKCGCWRGRLAKIDGEVLCRGCGWERLEARKQKEREDAAATMERAGELVEGETW